MYHTFIREETVWTYRFPSERRRLLFLLILWQHKLLKPKKADVVAFSYLRLIWGGKVQDICQLLYKWAKWVYSGLRSPQRKHSRYFVNSTFLSACRLHYLSPCSADRAQNKQYPVFEFDWREGRVPCFVFQHISVLPTLKSSAQQVGLLFVTHKL